MSDEYENATGDGPPAGGAADHGETGETGANGATGEGGRTGEGDGSAAYLRFPHLSGDRLCFVAEDDLWVAPSTPPAAPGG